MGQADLDPIAYYWNGAVDAPQARLDVSFALLTETLLVRADLQPGAAALDVGCGAGDTALAAAPCRLPGQGDRRRRIRSGARAKSDGTDRNCAGLAPISWIEADAAGHAFGSERFDRTLSRFSVTFRPDSERAFRQLRGTLVPRLCAHRPALA